MFIVTSLRTSIGQIETDLAVVELPLDEEGLDTSCSENLSGTSPRRASSDHTNAQGAIQSLAILDRAHSLEETSRCRIVLLVIQSRRGEQRYGSVAG